MSNKRKSQRVAAAGKGQLWLSAEGVDAAIWAYRKAMLSDGRAYVVIRELMFLGDFARELGRETTAVEAYREALEACLGGGRVYACRYWRDAYYCALMVDSILGNEGCTEMDRVLDFFNSASRRC
ncbi:hypothetical protein [Butyricimonas synergistica]|uniref:hypothetical protein n=1 Tax=Butyricimonas synergistica TaxID=544644 RepID=UPI000477F797|nr:hypothetical protein [Butyricimonas synergistica]